MSESWNTSAEHEILDATCGGRSIWCDGQKDHENTLYIDRREVSPDEFKHRNYSVEPDEIQDFRDLPYPDGSFNLVVFDPPHKKLANGMDSITGVMNRQYGALHAETWQSDIRAGFEELWRVLSPAGTLVFKFAENQIPFDDILSLAPAEPLFGTTTKNTKNGVHTRWFVFYKEESKHEQ